MKKAAIGILLICVFISCKKEIKEKHLVPEKAFIEEPVSKGCYRSVINKDTILMNLTLKGNELVSGNLDYNFFEKDENKGLLVGELKGDTLFADYTFMSEGVLSMREVVFLKQGNNYVEGFGDVVDDNKGKVTFKDKKQLKFDGKVVLLKVDCK